MLEGAAGGIELDRKGDELKDGEDEVNDNAEVDEPEHMKEEAAKHDEGEKRGGEVGGGNEGHAQVEGGEGDLVLKGVAGFVGGDAEGGEAGAAVVFGAEGEAFVDGVVVVGEVALNFFDCDIVNAGGAHDGGGDFGTGERAAGADLGPFGVGGADAVLGPKAEAHGGKEEENEFEDHGGWLESGGGRRVAGGAEGKRREVSEERSLGKV